MVNASSSAWVGCSWVPSPALTTDERTQPEWASRCGAPLAPWRMTTASAPIASRVSAVSLSDSPLDSEEPLAEKLMTSAESRLAAASKEMRVRVESSKNRLTTVRPRRAGSFLIGRSASERISSAVREDQLGVLAGQVGGAEQVALHRAPPFQDGDGVDAVDVLEADPDPLGERGREVLADEVGADRQLAVAAVDQHGELHAPAGRPTSVSASSAARMVRPEKSTSSTSTTVLPSMPPGGISVGISVRAGLSRRSSRYIVTSSDPTGTVDALDRGHPLGDALGERDAARRDPEQHEVVGAAVALEDLVGDAGEGPGDVTGVEDGAGVVRLLRSLLQAGRTRAA